METWWTEAPLYLKRQTEKYIHAWSSAVRRCGGKSETARRVVQSRFTNERTRTDICRCMFVALCAWASTAVAKKTPCATGPALQSSMKLCFSLTSLSFGLRCRVPGARRVLVDFHWVQWLRLKKTWRQARGCRAMFSTSRLVECRSVFSPGPSCGILCGSELLSSLLR